MIPFFKKSTNKQKDPLAVDQDIISPSCTSTSFCSSCSCIQQTQQQYYCQPPPQPFQLNPQATWLMHQCAPTHLQLMQSPQQQTHSCLSTSLYGNTSAIISNDPMSPTNLMPAAPQINQPAPLMYNDQISAAPSQHQQPQLQQQQQDQKQPQQQQQHPQQQYLPNVESEWSLEVLNKLYKRNTDEIGFKAKQLENDINNLYKELNLIKKDRYKIWKL